MIEQLELDNIAPEDTTVLIGKPRHLRYTLKSMRDLLRKYGTLGKVFEILETAGNSGLDITDKDLETLADLILAGVQHEDKTVTADDILDSLEIADMPMIVNAVVSAVTKATPKANPQ